MAKSSAIEPAREKPTTCAELLAEVIQQGRDVGSVRELDRIGLRAPEAAGVVANHAVGVAKGGDLVIPHAQVRDAGVDHHDGFARALRLVVDACAVRLEGAALTCHAPMLAPIPDDP